MTKKALITGITGQDGSYLAELLLSKGYEVHGLVRRTSTVTTGRIAHLLSEGSSQKPILHYGDLSDSSGLQQIMDAAAPHEVYNLGAQSDVGLSFVQSEYTADVTGVGVLRLLEAIRRYQLCSGSTVKFYQASSSEMFGSTPPPQHLGTRFHPRSPYAVAKCYGFAQTVNHREAYGLFGCNGILFNHESERRGENFVTRKITRAVGRIKLGLQQKLYLGNLDARRDWGYARDFVEAMYLMLQRDQPADYIIATDEAHSVQEFVTRAFAIVDLDYRDFVEISPEFIRPSEVNYLQGDSRESRRLLDWEPKTNFEDLVRIMVEADLELARQEAVVIDAAKLRGT